MGSTTDHHVGCGVADNRVKVADCENYLVKVVGCELLSDSITSKTYLVYDGLQLTTVYHFPISGEQLYVGTIIWMHLGHPAKTEILSKGMTAAEVRSYLTRRILDFSFK